MSAACSDDSPVARLLDECAQAAPAAAPAIAQTLLALVKVLHRRAAAAAADEVAREHAKHIAAALARIGPEQDGEICFALWTPAIAETTRLIERGEAEAALVQLAAMLRDAGLPAKEPEPTGPIDRLWSDGRFVSIDSSGRPAPLGGDCRWYRLPGIRDKFVLPTREVILDNADVEVMWPAPLDHGVPEHVLNEAQHAMIEAVRWIGEVSPRHLAWIDRLVCGFAITEMPEDSDLSSGSYKSRPGVVHISFPLDPVMVAETLIHEASHQHYLLLNSVVPLVDPEATEFVFSPIKGCERPLVRCAFAHHACFNIWDFMRRALSGRYGVQAGERMVLMAGYTEVLGMNVLASGRLTEAGTAFLGGLQAQTLLPEAA
ncbi:HEXXH motif-containing putative peptide modification protein [Erythrobacter sp. JK5]|uniref:aKG-HExxH-type peptide beta-hydroxylase n=1 Tax=Erythrobacter sp. JK5 TaxID=2829500 RepID=UPI001BA80FD6|nr:HEXXH motif-containing putative peptide modification protein [Erythrobacter sp. JK5]QUL38780.1 hypothetical protein KDC96_05255 [Erythrobacter sp. JK5]